MGQLSLWIDEDGDLLELSLDHEIGFFKHVGDGVFERVDEEGNTIGFLIHDVKSCEERELPFDAEFTRLSRL